MVILSSIHRTGPLATPILVDFVPSSGPLRPLVENWVFKDGGQGLI